MAFENARLPAPPVLTRVPSTSNRANLIDKSRRGGSIISEPEDSAAPIDRQKKSILLTIRPPADHVVYFSRAKTPPKHSPEISELKKCYSEASVNPRRCWAGLYEVSPDHHPILGESPEVEGLFLANGYSGHGTIHSPAAGVLLSDLLLEGGTDLLDIQALRPSRFSEGESIKENLIL
jgi:glycine/D-amino acid oxidase-like deaminating enzyme